MRVGHDGLQGRWARAGRDSLHRWIAWHRAPRDCGGGAPRYADVGWADDVSPDQACLEAAVEPLLRPTDVMLHLGIGSSHLARRFADRVARLDGLTVVSAELVRAPVLPRYHPRLGDKYRTLPEGPYDWILDNNPSSFACCRHHFLAFLDGCAARLAPGGRLVTELRGLQVESLSEGVVAWRRA